MRGALETLLHAVTTEDLGQEEETGQVQAGIVNSELLAQEPASIALLLSLLVCSKLPQMDHIQCQQSSRQLFVDSVKSELKKIWHDKFRYVFVQDEPDFYVRYHTLQLLTALLTNCPTRCA